MISNKIDLNSLREIIFKLNVKEQEELSRFLDDLILERRIKKFMERKKDIQLSLKDITAEVEKVREERYR